MEEGSDNGVVRASIKSVGRRISEARGRRGGGGGLEQVRRRPRPAAPPRPREGQRRMEVGLHIRIIRTPRRENIERSSQSRCTPGVSCELESRRLSRPWLECLAGSVPSPSIISGSPSRQADCLLSILARQGMMWSDQQGTHREGRGRRGCWCSRRVHRRRLIGPSTARLVRAHIRSPKPQNPKTPKPLIFEPILW